MAEEQEMQAEIQELGIEIPTPIELLEIPNLDVFAETLIPRDENGDKIEISDDLYEQLVNDLKDEQIKAETALADIGGQLEKKFKDFVRRRHLKELEWVNALLQHDGRSYNYSTKKGFIFNNDDFDTKPVVNITRQKVNLAIARMRDIQFPLGGDNNFRILPHKDVQSEMQQASPDPQAQQAAQQSLQDEYERARKMEQEIVTQLVKAKYGNKAREAMRDWVLLGTAVLKGPIIDVDRQKIYKTMEASDGSEVAELEYIEEEFPNTFRIDPKYWFPHPDSLVPEDLCESIEVHPLAKSKLIDLKINPAFMRKKLEEVVEGEPQGISGIGNLNELAFLTTDADLKNRYIVKEYHGPLPKKPLKDLGLIDSSKSEDSLQEVFGEVWFVEGTPIRISLSPLDGYDQIPYHVVPWERDDASLFGHGMAWMMRDAQRVAKSGWQMLLDNAGLSSGPQMVVHREMIKPANGKWEIEPHKIWYFTEYGQNAQEAFQFFNVPNNQQQIASVVEMAMQFGDLESESPMIMQNLIPQANNTASGQAMQLTVGNVTQRDKSQLWDDYGTRPLIEGYYHYNMQYNDKPGIKGNFEIELAGATEAIDAQLKAQEVERILALASQNPDFMLEIDTNEAFREIVTASRVGKRIVRSKEAVEAERQRLAEEQQNQGPSPEEMRAQAVLIREQTRQQENQMEAQFKQSEMELAQRKAEMEYETDVLQSQTSMIEAQTKREIELIKLAAEMEMDVAQLMKDFEIKSMQEMTKLSIQEIKAQLQQEEIDIKRRTGSGI